MRARPEDQALIHRRVIQAPGNGRSACAI